MPLFSRNFQSLNGDSLEDLANTTAITRLSAGGKARAILEAVNKRLEEQYDIFDLNLARAFVSSAPGQFLDLIGQLLQVTREGAVAAAIDSDMQTLRFYVESGTFGDINGGATITIPQGHVISTDPGGSGISYRTIEEVTLTASQSSVWFAAEAVVPGADSNIGTGALTHHSFNNYVDSENDSLLVENVHQISNGKNFESDANYRFRIVNRVLEGEAANLTAVRLAVLSTPGIADAIIIRRYRGIGTFGVILKSVTPTVSDSLIAAVTSNVERVQSLGALAFIRKPLETGVTLSMTVHYGSQLSEDEFTQIEESLESTITEFVNNLDIGETFLVDRMVAELFGVSDQITNFGESGKPIDELFVHVESTLRDNKVRQVLLGDYVAATDERVIIEPSVASQIVFSRAFTRR